MVAAARVKKIAGSQRCVRQNRVIPVDAGA